MPSPRGSRHSSPARSPRSSKRARAGTARSISATSGERAVACSSPTARGSRRPVSRGRRRTTPPSTRCSASAPTGSRVSCTHRRGSALPGPSVAGRAGRAEGVGGVGGAAQGGSASPPGSTGGGGVGDFRSLTPSALYSAALAAPGLSNAEAQLVCVGSAVPTPDWTQYAQDPATIPSQCLDTATTVTITPHPNATVFDPGYGAPHAWRASLGVQRRVHGTYTVSVDASYARGRSQYGFRDLNLVGTPRFTLPDEANRPVYVPADSIVSATGALSLQQSRVNPRYGQVIAIGSDLQSDSRQLTLGLGGFTARGATFQLSYTLTHAPDPSSFSSSAASPGFARPPPARTAA